MKLMNELVRRRGQIAAPLKQLAPQASGRRLERQRTKRVADPPHQCWQVPLKSPPITTDEFVPTRYLWRGLAVKTLGDGRRVDRPIRLRKLRQTTDADATMPTPEPPNPNPQHHRGRRADIPMVITQRFQGQSLVAVGTVFWRRDLMLMILFGILFGGQ